MDFKPCVNVFPLMGGVWIERKPDLKTRAEEKPEEAVDSKKGIRSAQERGKQLLKVTAKATPRTDSCYRLMIRNRAIHSHLIYFCGVIQYALSHEWRIAYGEYRARLSPNALKVFHTSLRDWTRKNLACSVSAISLGIGVNGYVRVYFVTTAEDALTVHDTALRLARYLRKRNFIPIVLRPYEKDPLFFLRWKYCNEEIGSVEELLRGDLWHECWEVMRAGFSLPYCHRTLRTPEATAIVNAQAQEIAWDESTVNYSMKAQDVYACTTSALVDGSFFDDTEGIEDEERP